MDEDRGTDFDDLAEAYERMATALPLREHVEAHTLFALLGDVSGRAVLDLGCGSGLYTRTLRELGAASVAGVDSSEGMLGFARRRAAAEGMDISYFAREADAPPAEGDPELDGRFDLVYSVYVLCYAPTRQALSGFCRTARRALRPEGGRFVFATLNPDISVEPGYYTRYGVDFTTGPATRDGEEAPAVMKVPGFAEFPLLPYRWTLRTYEDVLHEAGFSAVDWVHPTVSAEGVAAFGEDHWADYLKIPHAVYAECTV
ncbi:MULTISPECIES: class I SAM-dependent methyltransferase [Streptomyces]|uniref:Methyltransferase domain-containing protein n=1 Tax=Streptomyces spinosisporus TaxID=2927582 RepID=A0ABS9XKF7_9ACTN|nr:MULTISPECIES: class I SAM-dependent methyltransferase [Streptomyces]MCI3242554.1 methyltransferase domain-containing protein [Streptomyces spinosisporus]WUB40358.1 methyltransferase domain-containing protein [Streptomyces sp. NBC_00588]